MRDVMVLCYHAVSPAWDADLSVTPESLDDQISRLLRHGWRATTFTDAVTGTAPGRVLAITFDDAFGSVARHALPILERHRAVATVFAPTAFMDGGGVLSWPGVEQWADTWFAGELHAMDWDGLRGLTAGGWEVGSHTCSHPRLTSLGDADLRRELEQSRQRCTEEIGVECRSLAFPYGDHDQRVVAATAAAGYQAAGRLSSHLRRAGRLAHPRIGIYRGDDPRRFGLKVARPMRLLRATRLWPAERGPGAAA